MSEIYLVRPRQEFITGFFPELEIYQSYPDIYDKIPPQQLFASGRFILGHFIDMDNNTLVLSGALYFIDNPANLAKYENGISNDRLETVRAIPVSQEKLEALYSNIRRYVDRERSPDHGAFKMRVIQNHETDFVNGLLSVLEEASETKC